MQLNYKHEFNGSPDQVAALFCNEALIDNVAKYANAIGHTVNIADDVTYLDPTLPAPESISRFFDKGIRIKQSFTWGEPDDADVRKGTFTVDIAGAPVSVEADATLSPTGPSSPEVVYVGELSMKIPLVGKEVETQVEPMTARASVGIERRVQDWLSRV